MLPKLISQHPYFHENLNKDEGIKLLEAPETEGNFLFCKDPEDKENEYWLLCKKQTNEGKFEVQIYPCSFHAERFGSILNGSFDNIFSGLSNIVNYVASLSHIALRFKSPFAIFTPQAVFNFQVQENKLAFKSDEAAFPKLPNEITNIIFQKLDDFGSLLQTARVSKSCYTLFSQNITKAIQLRETMEEGAISKAEAEFESKSRRRLIQRCGNGGLE